MLQNLQGLGTFPSPNHGSKCTPQHPYKATEWAEGTTDCPGRRSGTEGERTWSQIQPPLTSRIHAMEQQCQQHWHFYTERKRAQRPHKESIRHCKKLQNKGRKHTDRIANEEEKSRSSFSWGWLMSPPQLSQGWSARRRMGIQKCNRAWKEARSSLSCHCSPIPPNNRGLEN